MLLVFHEHLLFLSITEWIHFFLNWFAVTCVMGILHYILLRTYKPVAEVMVRRDLEKLNK